VDLRDGEVPNIEGDPDDQFNHGVICGKGCAEIIIGVPDRFVTCAMEIP